MVKTADGKLYVIDNATPQVMEARDEGSKIVVTGTVTEINEELKTSPDKINEAPHDTWIIKIKVADPAEAEKLLDAAAYEAFIAEEQ